MRCVVSGVRCSPCSCVLHFLEATPAVSMPPASTKKIHVHVHTIAVDEIRKNHLGVCKVKTGPSISVTEKLNMYVNLAGEVHTLYIYSAEQLEQPKEIMPVFICHNLPGCT